jgi:hypothetical protein
VFAAVGDCLGDKGLNELRDPTTPILKRLYDLPDSPGSDYSRGAPHQAVLSVGWSAGGGMDLSHVLAGI